MLYLSFEFSPHLGGLRDFSIKNIQASQAMRGFWIYDTKIVPADKSEGLLAQWGEPRILDDIVGKFVGSHTQNPEIVGASLVDAR